jgi:tetratricopeptide (TPR) repeat protein
MSNITSIQEPSFVGRDHELKLLHGFLDLARQGRGGLVVLKAESGGGKSRLLQEFARSSDCQVFWSQGAGHAAAKPLSLLSTIAETALKETESNSDFASHLGAILRPESEVLDAALPVLRPLLGDTQKTFHGSEAATAERTARVLGSFLGGLGSSRAPALVILDDCQWADALSLQAVQYWQNQSSVDRYVLIVTGFRDSALPAEHPLLRSDPLAEIALKRLDGGGIERIIQSMAGPTSAAVVTMVRRLAADNPFMITTIVRGLVESGLVEQKNGAWELSELQSSASTDAASGDQFQFIRNRLTLLSRTTLDLLKVGAVVGKQFSIELCHWATSSALDKDYISDAVNRHLIVPTPNGYSFAHDKIRECLLDMLSEEMLSETHLRIAEALSSHDPSRSFEISFHFDAAGYPEKALPFAIRSAEEARARKALEVSELHYRIALRGAPQSDRATRQRLSRGLGEILAGRAKFAEAAICLRQARDLTDDDLEKARIDVQRCVVYSHQNDASAALAAVQEGLALFGERLPESMPAQITAILRAVLVQTYHSLFPGRLKRHRPTQPDAREVAIGELYSNSGYPLYFDCRLELLIYTQLEALNRLECQPDTPQLAFALGTHGVVCGVMTLFKRSRDYAKRGIDLRKHFGEPWGVGNGHHLYGICLLAAAENRAAADNFIAGLSIFEKLGYRWDEDILRCNLMFALYRLGSLQDAIREAERTFKDGIDLQDLQSIGPAISGWAKASGGQVPAEVFRRIDALNIPIDLQTRTEIAQSRAICRIAEGKLDDAIEILQTAWDTFRAAKILQEYVSPTIPWLATALRLKVESLAQGPERQAVLKRAKKVAKSALSAAKKFRNNLPHAWRELGLLAILEGDYPRAIQLLAKSAAVAEALHARYEIAQTQLARAQLRIIQGVAEGQVELARAREALTQVGANLKFHGLSESGPQ